MKKELSIEGMNCGHCSNAVDKALRAVSGVKEVAVDLAGKKAVVEAEGVADDVLKKAVEDAGYQVVAIR